MDLNILAVVARLQGPQTINYVIGFLILVIVIILGSVLLKKNN